MPEHDCLPPDVSATEFVVHMARMSGLPTTAARERTADTLRHVGLYEERYRPIGGYSTGMKQRVKLAQALVHDPQLVLLDEPTNGLDPAGRDEMLALIRRIGTDFGISVLVTSHLLGELERICDHVVVIDGGRLLRSASTADVTAATQQLTVEVTDRADEVAARLAAAGVTVRRAGALLGWRSPTTTTYDLVRDAVAELGVGLVRLQRGATTCWTSSATRCRRSRRCRRDDAARDRRDPRHRLPPLRRAAARPRRTPGARCPCRACAAPTASAAARSPR